MALGLVPTQTAVQTRTKVAGAGVGVVAIVLIVLAAAGVFSGSGTVGQVHLVHLDEVNVALREQRKIPLGPRNRPGRRPAREPGAPPR